MAHARSAYPTLHEILKIVSPLGASGGGSRKNFVSTVEGLSMKPVPKREGLHTLTPEQLASIRVPVQCMDGDAIRGYQRHLRVEKARRFARFLVATRNYLKVLPVAEVSIDGDNAFWTDGQHRGAGAIIARKPLRVVVTKRTEAEARKLFALQAEGTKPPRNVLIFDGDGPFEEYIQDAVTDATHPWNGLITTSHAGQSKTKMSATAAMGILRTYVARTSHITGATTDHDNSKFDKRIADEMALLVSTFGTKATNPLAFTSTSLRAIAETARQVFREREPHKDDRERWVRHMSKFNFSSYQHIRSYSELTERMIRHWNKHLSDDRKVKLV